LSGLGNSKVKKYTNKLKSCLLVGRKDGLDAICGDDDARSQLRASVHVTVTLIRITSLSSAAGKKFRVSEEDFWLVFCFFSSLSVNSTMLTLI
jgi:hypothetical protein